MTLEELQTLVMGAIDWDYGWGDDDRYSYGVRVALHKVFVVAQAAEAFEQRNTDESPEDLWHALGELREVLGNTVMTFAIPRGVELAKL